MPAEQNIYCCNQPYLYAVEQALTVCLQPALEISSYQRRVGKLSASLTNEMRRSAKLIWNTNKPGINLIIYCYNSVLLFSQTNNLTLKLCSLLLKSKSHELSRYLQ